MGSKRVLFLPLRVVTPGAALLALILSTACGTSRQSPALPDRSPAESPASETVSPPPSLPEPVDPVAVLIERSESHYAAGERELQLGHLDQARHEFDRAVDVLLESHYGGRWDTRLREHFDRLVDRINAREVMALAQGDGFTEKTYEQASIDELLEFAMFVTKPVAVLSTREAVEAGLHAHDVPIPLNDRVLSYVELFQGRLRDYVQDALSRGSQYLPMIESVFRAEGLPLDLAFIPIVESAFKPNALSRAKAKGVWQFMRGTALENGLRHDWYIDERSDPEKATLAAAKYLKTLYRMFGDWHLALASYNGGPGRVQRALNRFKADDFWSLARRNGSLPRETREYVPMILAAMVIARNPAQFGIEFETLAPILYDKVTVPRGVDLRRVAEWTGATIDEIQALNPELRRWTTPVRYEYDVKVPAGTASLFQEKLAATPAAELTAVKHYTVRRGESIRSIAQKLKVNRLDLAEANHLKINARLRAGQSLIIPRAPATVLAANTRPAPPALPTARGNGTSSPAVVATTARNGGQAGTATTYRVRRGDTLSSIAKMFNTTVAHIKEWNGLTSTRIVAGDRLTIFASRVR